ncbi:MAG: PQQ-dependent sugar dehydrogenase [Frankia sp.]|nr:PQQ-dependent sugar dehydrogenase [Frankia sp.]
MGRVGYAAISVTLLLLVACRVNTGRQPAPGSAGPTVGARSAVGSATRPPAALNGPPVLVRVGTFDRPLYVTSPPGDARLFVVEQAGRVRVVKGGATLGAPFLDISADTRAGGERGLLSIAFAPDYPSTGLFYVDYTDRSGDTHVVEFRVDAANPDRADVGTRRELLFVRQPYANHNGGLLLFDPSGALLIGLGDGGSGGDPDFRAQNLGDLLGKILRVDPKPAAGRPYGIPRDNPFVARRGARPEVWAYGLRNPWRFSFDAADRLWIGDVGQNRVEEIDVVAPDRQSGANYGWSVYEGDEGFSNRPLTRAGPLITPVVTYRNGSDGRCSVTAGGVYAGSAATLRNSFVYGDYCSADIWSVRLRGDGRVTTPTRLPISVPSLSSFGTDSNGEMYVTSLAGGVWRIAAGS